MAVDRAGVRGAGRFGTRPWLTGVLIGHSYNMVGAIIAIALVVAMMLGIMLWGVFTERRR
jgi:hypothetical protein